MIGHVNGGQDNDRRLTNRIMTGQWQDNERIGLLGQDIGQNHVTALYNL